MIGQADKQIINTNEAIPKGTIFLAISVGTTIFHDWIMNESINIIP